MLSGDRKIAQGLKSMDTMLAYRGACGRSSIAARQGLAILKELHRSTSAGRRVRDRSGGRGSDVAEAADFCRLLRSTR
jgi:hypothetical protein